MTSHDDFDRRLAGWFEADALSPVPPGALDRVVDATRRRRPRPTWLAGPGSHWVGVAHTARSGSGARTLARSDLRWSTALILLLATLALLGGAILIGARLTQPSPLPTGELGRLAYIVDGALYLADWDGRNPERVGGASNPDPCDAVHLEGDIWSPDGQYIAYRSGHQNGCTATVHIRDAQGNPIAAFAAGVGWKAEWAPDSKRIVTWGTLNQMIEVHGVDGDLKTGVRLPENFCVCGDYDPGWAPDGASLLLKSLLIPLDGGAPKSFLAGGSGITHAVRDPSTSADGTLVTFVASGTLFLAAVDDMTAARALVEDGDLADPLMSPTGDQIAVAASPDLVIVDAASGQLTTLATGSGIDAIEPLAFSPDGDRVLFSQVVTNGQQSALWSVPTDASGAPVHIATADRGDWQHVP